jgi:NTE family protein
MVNSAAATAARRDQTDLLLQPDLKSIDMLNWKAFDQAVEAGYRYSLQRLAELTPELAERLHLGRPDAIG